MVYELDGMTNLPDVSLTNTLTMSVFCTHTHTYTRLGSASLYDFTVKDAAGKDFPLSKLNDKKAILVVNVASQCA